MNCKAKHIIVGIHVTDRVKHVKQVQDILTCFGCYIKTRLGLHEASPDFCSPNGLLILELLDDDVKHADLVNQLKLVEGIEVKEMVFEHP
ncbi:MAG: hypothetical protein NTX50_15090 [Candidatus Sumerlaeota bacterium]|nr:hypothetical protein [Candidatus Sumerlaeota bacterium]